MGYYLEFHFDSSEEFNKQELIVRLERAGAILHEDEHYAPDPHISYCGYGLFLNESEQTIAEGRWIFGRAPRDKKRLDKWVQFVKRLGCTLYDPQEQVEITESTIQRVCEGLEKYLKVSSRLFGTVKNDDETTA